MGAGEPPARHDPGVRLADTVRRGSARVSGSRRIRSRRRRTGWPGRSVAARTEEAVAAALGRAGRLSESDAATLARVVSAVGFLTMAASVNATASVDEILRDVRDQLAVVLPR